MRLVVVSLNLLIVLTIVDVVASSLQHPSHRRRRRKRRHDEYDDASAADDDDDEDDYAGDDASIDDVSRGKSDDDEERNVIWQNPEHPERRQGRYIGDDQTEFVRTEVSEHVYNKIRTYSTGALPRQVECYSCMSLSYQTSWKYLQGTYIYPKVFTDRCRDPNSERGMPTVMCSSVCVSMMEPDIEAGVFIGFKHIRGCLDRVLRNGFNQSALRTHRFQQNVRNQCRTLSRSALFNPARATDPPAIGDVQLCSCYGDRCNSSMQMSNLSFLTISIFLLSIILANFPVI